MTEENNSSAEQGSVTDEILQNTKFGAPLKEAREKAGMTVEGAAQQLLITEDIVDAIENSRIGDLPSATFTIGYIRSYARILDIPADEIIALYNAVNPDAENQMSPSPFAPAEEKQSDGSPMLLIVIVILLVAAFIWWSQKDASVNLNENKISTPDTEQPGKSFNTYTVEETGTKEFQSTPDPVSLNDDESSDAVTAEVVVENLVEAAEQLDKQELTTDVEMSSHNDVLVLTAIGDSWCEITDATGNRLFYQLLKAEDEKVIYGVAPFQVFLGNATAVRIESNRKIVSFDHLINSSKNTARLIITADSKAARNTNR